MAQSNPKRQRKRLKIECRKTKCDENKHCFLDPPKRRKLRELLASPIPEGAPGPPTPEEQAKQSAAGDRRCWNCGVELVDWRRIHTLHPEDMDYLIDSLKTEYVRHEHWCKEI